MSQKNARKFSGTDATFVEQTVWLRTFAQMWPRVDKKPKWILQSYNLETVPKRKKLVPNSSKMLICSIRLYTFSIQLHWHRIEGQEKNLPWAMLVRDQEKKTIRIHKASSESRA